MTAKKRDVKEDFDQFEDLHDDPSLPDPLRANRQYRRNAKRIREFIEAFFTVKDLLDYGKLVVSLAGCHHLSQRTISDHIINRTGFYTRPKHRDCLGRFSLGPTIPMPGDFHTTESRDFPNVTPLQLAPITCGRRLSLVAGCLLRYPIVTYLLDAAGERLCCVQDSPTAQAPALLEGTCARAVLMPSILGVQARCGDDPLLDTVLTLTNTLPDHASAVLRIMSPAVVELDGYVEQIGGRHA